MELPETEQNLDRHAEYFLKLDRSQSMGFPGNFNDWLDLLSAQALVGTFEKKNGRQNLDWKFEFGNGNLEW